MTQIGRTSRRLRSTTAAAAVMVAAAVLVAPSAQATVTSTSSSVTLSVQDSTPSGAVGGVQSPAEAGSTLNLVIDASEAGAGLASARASIGPNSASVPLCPTPGPAGGGPGGECPESVSNVPLSIDVGGEGAHELLVTVTDTAGRTGTLADQTIDITGPPAPGTNAIVLGLAGGFPGPPGPPPHEPPAPEPPARGEPPSSTPPVCPSPMLEMHLASRPVGYTRQGVPVLVRGLRYLFAGRLTCLQGRRRVGAPDGTPVRVLLEHPHDLQGQAHSRHGRLAEYMATVHEGRLQVRLPILRPGTILFDYQPRGGESVQVRLRVAVTHEHRRGRTRRHRGHHGRTRRHRAGRRR